MNGGKQGEGEMQSFFSHTWSVAVRGVIGWADQSRKPADLACAGQPHRRNN